MVVAFALLVVLLIIIALVFTFTFVWVGVAYACVGVVHASLLITHIVRSWWARLRGRSPTHRA